MHEGSIKPGSRVVIVDDLLATGGTARAAAELTQKQGGVIAGYAFVVELDFLPGRAKLLEGVTSKPVIYSIVHVD